MDLKMVEVFKTNVRQRRQAKLLLGILEKRFPLFRINFDLEDCDKILRVEGENIQREKIAKLVTENGYQCNILD
ncbi:MAG: hypothetical protein ACXVB0_18310 [Mucilaginibacter sp.]